MDRSITDPPSMSVGDTTDMNDPGKMFVGGLSWQTTSESLTEYFCKYGEIKESIVMRDPTTKRSRGFGFVTFREPTSVDKVLANGTHQIDEKKVDPKLAVPKRAQPKVITKTKKVFIGGVSAPTTFDDIKQYFEQEYGVVEDGQLMFDKATARHRGFGFVIFEDENVAHRVCEIHFHEIKQKMVEAKKAQPKDVMQSHCAAQGLARGYLNTYPAMTAFGRPLSGFAGQAPGFFIPAAAGMGRGRGRAASFLGFPGGPGMGSMAGYPTGYNYMTAATIPGADRLQTGAYITDAAAFAAGTQASHLAAASAAAVSREAAAISQSSPMFTKDQYSHRAVLSGYAPAAYGAPTSPASRSGFPPANSPSPIDLYSTQDVGYVQATSPQPNGAFPNIAVSRTGYAITNHNGYARNY